MSLPPLTHKMTITTLHAAGYASEVPQPTGVLEAVFLLTAGVLGRAGFGLGGLWAVSGVHTPLGPRASAKLVHVFRILWGLWRYYWGGL